MSDKKRSSQLSKSALATRVDELRVVLQQVPVNLLSERTGANYQAIGPGRGEFRLSLVDAPIIVTFPDFRIIDANDNELPSFYQAMLLYYFDSPSAVPMTGRWISFAELPDGRIYDSAFQGNTGNLLVKTFGMDIKLLRTACESLEGIPLRGFGDLAYMLQALPHIPMMVNYWQGDEDFPSTCKLLFDETVSQYLPTEACAILGGMLARKLIKNAL
jgi:hypothetical protein